MSQASDIIALTARPSLNQPVAQAWAAVEHNVLNL